MYLVLWNLFCKAVTCGSKLHVTGQENMPSGAKIFACNHPTSLDPCYVYRYTENSAILMTKFVFDLPVVGTLMNGCGFLPVKARSQDQKSSAYAMALNTLLKGRSILLAPEGKMSPDNPSHKAHKGAVRLAGATGFPIIPMGLRHEGKVRSFYIKDQLVRFMPRGQTFLKIGTPHSVYGGDLEFHTDLLMSYIYTLAAQ